MPGRQETCHRGHDMTGANRRVTPSRARGDCRACLEINKINSRARARARMLAVTALATGSDSDRFAALVAAMRAELLAAGDGQVCPPTGGRVITGAERDAGAFGRRRVTLAEIPALTGLAATTVEQRARAARQARAEGTATAATMPLPAPGGTWRLAALALWRACCYQKYAYGNPQRWPLTHEQWAPAVARVLERHGGRVTLAQAAAELGFTYGGENPQLAATLLREAGWRPALPPAEQVIPVIGEVIASRGRGISAAEISEALAGGEVTAGAGRIGRLITTAGLREVRPGVPSGATPAVLESLRWDGLLTVGQLAAAYECGTGVVRGAVARGELTVARREGGRMLFDPATITTRGDLRIGPVDTGHRLALRAAPG